MNLTAWIRVFRRCFPTLVVLFGLLCTALGQQQVREDRELSVFQHGTPFSFIYGGKAAKDFLPSWHKSESNRSLADGRRLYTVTYRDPATHLEVSRMITLFPKGNAIEWMMTFHNAGTKDTPILEKILPLDAEILLPADAGVTFRYTHGSTWQWPIQSGEYVPQDYIPADRTLARGQAVDLAHYVFIDPKHENTWNKQDAYLPFFNAQWPGGGLIGAIGWTGQWSVHAERTHTGLLLQSGQQTTHLKLHPGETIRTPRILLVPWSGEDYLTGQNALRHVLLDYYVPRVHGAIAMPPIAHTDAAAPLFDAIARKTGKDPLKLFPTLTHDELTKMGLGDVNSALNDVSEKNQLQVIQHMAGLGFEAYWLDAGWFVGGWPNGRGSWAPNSRFPDGLAPLGLECHKEGLKFLLWYDPEGVAPGSMIEKEHPEWVLHSPQEGTWGGIFRWSDPAARKWMTDLLAKQIRDWHVDIFRMDRNTNPLAFWQAADTPDRQGMTEIRQIEGMYEMWDELLTQFPGLEIDNANWRVTGPDIEAMKRTIGSLSRSEGSSPDGIPTPTVDQEQTAELSLWIPLSANGLNSLDPYDVRSVATTGVNVGLDLQSPYVRKEVLRKAIAEVKALRPYWLGDYYPLTSINYRQDTWCGWQFDRPDLKSGFAMFFRRPQSRQSTYAAALHGIHPNATYRVSFAESYDVESSKTMSGKELQHLTVTIKEARSSLLVRYKEVANIR